MAIPDYQSLMLPLLQFAEARNEEISTYEAVDALSTQLGLTEADLGACLSNRLAMPRRSQKSRSPTLSIGITRTHS